MADGAQIAAAGLSTEMDPSEAWPQANGLSQEFIALLTHAKRCRASACRTSGEAGSGWSRASTPAARLMTAHSGGLGLTADKRRQRRHALAAGRAPSMDAIGDA